MTPVKTAIVSHVLPPSPSGQAMVLYRLLSCLPPDRYCLLSRERYEGQAREGDASARLPAPYYHLRFPRQVPAFRRRPLSSLATAANTVMGIVGRARQISRIVERERCGLVIGCTGDLWDLPAARLAARWRRVPFIPYLFDDYVYQWTGDQRAIARCIEPFVLRGARDVIVPNEYLGEEYRRRHGVRATVVRNPCILPDLEELDRRPPAFDPGPASIVYAGAVYRAHYDAFRNLVAAIGQTGRTGLRLHIFTAQSPGELAANGIAGPFVVVHPHMDPEKVPSVLRRADILFLPLAFHSPIPEVVRTSCPGKTGEYLSVGRPILVHAPGDSFVAGYFREHGCGAVVARDDPQALSETVKKLLSDREMTTRMGRRAREMAERDFRIEEVGAVFRELSDSPGRP